MRMRVRILLEGFALASLRGGRSSLSMRLPRCLVCIRRWLAGYWRGSPAELAQRAIIEYLDKRGV